MILTLRGKGPLRNSLPLHRKMTVRLDFTDISEQLKERSSIVEMIVQGGVEWGDFPSKLTRIIILSKRPVCFIIKICKTLLEIANNVEVEWLILTYKLEFNREKSKLR